ncbi:MAG: putative pyruvate formate lyase activating enzyme [Clostridiales bacterium]|nr:putative pyruvate formate lyase activating enzyme [Clostridiales bacterium]
MEGFTEWLRDCHLCPRQCHIDRLNGQHGTCRAGLLPKVALASLHQWEEPCISGTRGSGTVFFSYCNLSCLFCQNYDISQSDFGKEMGIPELAELFIKQQQRGSHNINLVSPTSFMPQITEALIIAKEHGLTIPVIYNSNAYESVDALRYMDGLIDVYLPDLKYFSDEYAVKYSKAPHYFEHATAAIMEMYRQVGSPQFDDEGIIKRGLIIRHLMLPGLIEDSKQILLWIRNNLPTEVYVSLMAQYTPMYKAKEHKELNRRISRRQYEAIIDYFFDIGLENGYIQERSSAKSIYTPDFDLSGL